MDREEIEEVVDQRILYRWWRGRKRNKGRILKRKGEEEEKNMKKSENQERFSVMKNKNKKKKKGMSHRYGDHLIAIQNPNSQTLFAIILAALYSNDNSQKSLLIIRSLKLLHNALLHNLSPPVLSLLPILLNSCCAEIASKTTEIVGAAALLSIEANEIIASETGIVRGLINLLKCSTQRVSLAACNAILDLSTTSFGRQQLLQLSAVEKLMIPNPCLQ